jgi:NTP pyrophosphatase (non-canonical NTP hydrolase)
MGSEKILMNPNDYQKLAARTECSQLSSRARIWGPGYNASKEEAYKPTRLLHSVLGMSGEVGELAGNIEKWLYYGQDYDGNNLKEELGDLLWYIAEMSNAAGFRLSDIMEANIRKLKQRYPEKFDAELAKEENRDREAEMREDDMCGTIEEQTGQGWSEPPEEVSICNECGQKLN